MVLEQKTTQLSRRLEMKYDLIIKNALLFDGISDAASVQNIGIKDGIVTAISTSVIPEDEGVKIIDAQEHWVMPGYLEKAFIRFNHGKPMKIQNAPYPQRQNQRGYRRKSVPGLLCVDCHR